MKKFNIVTFTVLAFCAFGIIVKAASINYTLKFVGANDYTKDITMSKGHKSTIGITNNTRALDSQLGIAISQKTLFGYSTEIRRNPWVLDTSKYSYEYEIPKKDDYRGSVVWNAQKDNGLTGYMMGVLDFN